MSQFGQLIHIKFILDKNLWWPNEILAAETYLYCEAVYTRLIPVTTTTAKQPSPTRAVVEVEAVAGVVRGHLRMTIYISMVMFGCSTEPAADLDYNVY